MKCYIGLQGRIGSLSGTYLGKNLTRTFFTNKGRGYFTSLLKTKKKWPYCKVTTVSQEDNKGLEDMPGKDLYHFCQLNQTDTCKPQPSLSLLLPVHLRFNLMLIFWTVELIVSMSLTRPTTVANNYCFSIYLCFIFRLLKFSLQVV